MSDRIYHETRTQGIKHVEYNVSITLNASGVPVFVEGDKTTASAGSYLTLTDTGTGVIGIATVDPFLAVVNCTVSRSLATPTGNGLVDTSLWTQASNKTWSATICTWTNAAGTHSAADMVAGDLVNVHLVLRNSSVTP